MCPRIFVISRYDKALTNAAGRGVKSNAILHWYLYLFRRTLQMCADGLRQSDRVNFRMPVEASWFGDGTTFKRTATTMLVSKNGGVLRLAERLTAGQELTLSAANRMATSGNPRGHG